MNNQKQTINQLVLNNNTNTPEFYEQINRITTSLIHKRYGRSVWQNKNLIEELLASGMCGVCIALKKYNAERGEFLSYANRYIVGEMHVTYCLTVFNLTPYYAALRKHLLESLSTYYENHDFEILYNNLRHFKICKSAIIHLYNQYSIDELEACTCLTALKMYLK